MEIVTIFCAIFSAAVVIFIAITQQSHSAKLVRDQLENQVYLSKTQFSLRLLQNWNKQTTTDFTIFRNAFPNLYEHCNKLSCKKVNQLFEGLTNKNKNESIVANSIIHILNYFEYVSQSYLRNAANKQIIHESFRTTMVRLYFVLSNYILKEIITTGRNPWLPYTSFVTNAINGEFSCNDGKQNCDKYNECISNIPILNETQESAKIKFNNVLISEN